MLGGQTWLSPLSSLSRTLESVSIKILSILGKTGTPRREDTLLIL